MTRDFNRCANVSGTSGIHANIKMFLYMRTRSISGPDLLYERIQFESRVGPMLH